MANIYKSASIYTVGNALPQLIGFLLLPIYSHYMSPSEYGIVSSMETLGFILAIFMSLNLDRAAQRFYFDCTSDKERRELLGSCFLGSVFLATLFLLLLFAGQQFVQLIFPSIDFYPYYALCLSISALASLTLIPSVYFQVTEQAGKFILFKLTRFILVIGLSIWYVVFLEQGARGQMTAEAIILGCFVPVCFFIAHKHFSWHINFAVLTEGVKYSWPFIPTLLMAWVLNFSDRIFIERYVGLDELGIYSMSYRISLAVIVLTTAFATAYTPIFYRLASDADQRQAKLSIQAYGSQAAYAFLIIGFGLALFSKEITYYILDESYSAAHSYIRVLVFGHVLSAIMSVTSVLYILQAKKSKLNMYIAMAAAVINLLLNFLLIPDWGVLGACLATFVSMVVLAVLQYYFSKSCYFVPVPWLKLSLTFCCLISVLAFYHFYLEQFVFLSFISKLTALVLSIAVCYKFYWTKLKETLRAS